MIVILSRRSAPTYHFVNEVARRCDVGGIVFEQKRSTRLVRSAWRRARRVGWRRVIGQTCFYLYSVIYRRTVGQRDLVRILDPELIREVRDRTIPVLDVKDVNGEAVIEFLRGLKPDILVVNGTSVLRPEIFHCRPGIQTLNLHVGITPAYRGVHGGFWALSEGRPDRCGVTVHRVDAGIDTGEVLAQSVVPVDPSGETFWSVYLKQVRAGTELMIETIARVADGTATTITPDAGPSRLYFHPTLGEYLGFLTRQKS